MDGPAGAPLVPHGQHLALPELQKRQPHRTALSANRNTVRRFNLLDRLFFAARIIGFGHRIRRQRNRDSRRRHHQAAFSPHASPGAPDWLTLTAITPPSLLWEGKLCWDVTYANCSNRPILPPKSV